MPQLKDTAQLAGLEIREMHVREVDTDKREITGIAVPYGQIADIAGIYREEIAPGAVQDSDNAKFFDRHYEPVGKITSHRDTAEGWEITASISATARGDDVYTLLRDGVLDRLSIGFEPVEHTETIEDDGSLTVTRTKIRVLEVSAVPFPAYDGAAVTAVRHRKNKENEMPTDTLTPQVTEIRETVEDLSRRFDQFTTAAPQDSGPQFRSFGEYVKAVASGDEAALRAYEGAVSGDTVLKDAWVGDLVRIMTEKQPIKNSFSTGVLPADGMKVEYAQLKSDTTKVEKQESEGTDLAFGKVAIETKSADIETYGGYSTLSRQAIERASVGILDTTFTALAMKYAKAIETKVRSVVTTAETTASAVNLAADPDDIAWLELLIDLAEKFDDVDRTLSGLFVSKNVFLSLAALESKDRLLQISGAPLDKAGTLTISSIEANLAGLPVKVFPGWTGNKALAYDPFAIKTLESPGAPTRLQDENIVNLSKDFSVYGYASSFVQAPDSLARVKFQTA